MNCAKGLFGAENAFLVGFSGVPGIALEISNGSIVWSLRHERVKRMNTPPQSISTYETKTRLAEILRQVRLGQGFVITQRGQSVAELLPTGAGAGVQRAGRAAAKRMRLFTQSQPAPTEPVDIKALIDDGRD